MLEYIRHWLKGHRLAKCSDCERKMWVEWKRFKDFKCSYHQPCEVCGVEVEVDYLDYDIVTCDEASCHDAAIRRHCL